MQVCNQYILGEAFGQGSTGSVLFARDVHHDNPSKWDLAAKLVRLRHQDETDAFEAEFSATETVQGHANIISLYGAEICGFRGSYGVLVMEQGDQDLLDYMLANNGLSISSVRRIFFDVLAAVSHCHQLKVAHRDIKPENVIMVQGSAKLADFGAARDFFDPSDRTCHDQVGTAIYTPPEVFQMSSKGYDCVKLDIWSLGILFHVLLTGCWPYPRGHTEPSPELLIIEERFAKVPQCLDLLKRLLASDPADRPSAAEAMLHPFFLPAHVTPANLRQRALSTPAVTRRSPREDSGRSRSEPAIFDDDKPAVPTVSDVGKKKTSVASRIIRNLRPRSVTSKVAAVCSRVNVPARIIRAARH